MVGYGRSTRRFVDREFSSHVLPGHPMEQPTAPNQMASLLVMRLVSSPLVSGALRAMLALDLPDHFSQTGQSVDSVAGGLNAQPEALLILIKALASIGLFIEISPGIYAPTDACRLLRKSGALRGTAEWLMSPMYQQSCHELLHS